jgi:hypothetical protein
MSLSREDSVVCPSCGVPGRVTLHASVNVTVSPELKERLLAGSLSVFSCDSCGKKARVAHPVLYHDMNRALLVQLDPQGTFDGADAARVIGSESMSVTRTRVVRDGNALIEKVRIDDADLDDRVIEVLKLLLAVVHPDYLEYPWYFERIEPEGLLFTILTPKGPMASRRPRAEYDKLEQDLRRRGILDQELPPFAEVGALRAREWMSTPESVS